LILLSKIIDDL